MVLANITRRINMTKKVLTLVERKLAVLDYFQGTQDVVPNEQFIAELHAMNVIHLTTHYLTRKDVG